MARLMSSTELAKRLNEDRDILLIDLLEPENFAKEHIPTAVNIPLATLRESAKTFKKNQRIVVYGSNHDDEASNQAAELLEELGFRKVSDFDGGIYAWKQAGYLCEVPEAG